MNKNKRVSFFVIFFICLISILFSSVFFGFFENYCSANNKNEYDFSNIGMKVLINNNFKDKVKELQNMEESEEKNLGLMSYKNNGVVADFFSDEKNMEILIMAKTSSYYRDMPNLKLLPDEDIENLKNKFVESIENDGKNKIEDSNIIKTSNYNAFIKISTSFVNEDKKINMDIYYTILNGRLITISFRSYDNKDIELQNEILESMKFYEVERPKFISNQEKMNFVVGFTIIMTLVLFIVIFFIRRKDKKILNNNIKDKEIKSFSKFGGLLMGFWMILFYQIIIQVTNILNYSSIKDINLYISLVIIQDIVITLISMYLIYNMVRRKDKSPKNIINANIYLPIIIGIISIIRVIYVAINPNGVNLKIYIKDEINMIISNAMYSILWIIYFYFSKRVKVYYYLPVKSIKETFNDSKIGKSLKNRKRNRDEGKNN